MWYLVQVIESPNRMYCVRAENKDEALHLLGLIDSLVRVWALKLFETSNMGKDIQQQGVL